jgi:adenylate kinase
MFIRIGGIPGVGKTTIINEIVEKSSQLKIPVVKIKGAEYLMNVLDVSSYDELRQIPEQVRAQARPEMYRRMYEDDNKDPNTIRLRDAHYSLWQDESGFIQFLSLEEDKKQMLSMVCLTASEDTILQRRRDDGRSDRNLDIDIIRRELIEESKSAKEQAESLGINLVQVENIGEISLVCANIVERTMGRFDFKQDLLRGLLERSPAKERF